MEPIIETVTTPVAAIEKTAGWWASRSTGTKVVLGLLGIGIIVGGGILAYNHFKKEDKPWDDEKLPEPVTEQAVDLYTLPNHGIGCSAIRDSFDNNFNYVKCNGVWYVISKENPSNETTKGKYVDWTVLESEVTTKLLNTRYPN